MRFRIASIVVWHMSVEQEHMECIDNTREQLPTQIMVPLMITGVPYFCIYVVHWYCTHHP